MGEPENGVKRDSHAIRATKNGSKNAAAVRKADHVRGRRRTTRRVRAASSAAAQPSACFVFAHGAGAGMAHPFMAAVANGLAERNIATLRYQFPYMEKRAKRPDPPKVAHAAVRAAVAEARRHLPNLPLIAGGKSFGGRMTSQAQALEPLDGVVGLAFLGFPLHPAKRPSRERAAHLADVQIPMLFLQGTRDALAELERA